jgi:hypothetical protein
MSIVSAPITRKLYHLNIWSVFRNNLSSIYLSGCLIEGDNIIPLFPELFIDLSISDGCACQVDSVISIMFVSLVLFILFMFSILFSLLGEEIMGL